MDDSSLSSTDTIRVELASQKTLQPKVLVDYHVLKIIRIVVLGLHLIMIALIAFIDFSRRNFSSMQDISFWILLLSTVYFAGVVFRNADKQPTNYLAGFFHATWVLSIFTIVKMLSFTIPLHDYDDETQKSLMLLAEVLYCSALSLDFALNKLLLQKIISVLCLLFICTVYMLFRHFVLLNKQGEDGTRGGKDARVLMYKAYMLYFFIIVAAWLLYLILHRHKYHNVKRKAVQSNLRVGPAILN